MRFSVLSSLRQNKGPESDPVHLGKFLAKLSRPQNSLSPGLLTITTYYSTNNNPIVSTAIVLYVLIFALYSVASTINNIQDLSADIINNRHDNPLTTGTVQSKHIVGFIGAMITIIIATNIYLASNTVVLITSCFVLLLYAYSTKPLWLKSRGLYGTLSLAICYTALPILLGASHLGHIPLDVLWINLTISIASISTLLFKDYKDEQGDQATGAKTPLLLHGAKTITIFSLIATLLSTLGVIILAQALNTGHAPIVLAIMYSLVTLSMHISSNRYINLRARSAKLLLIATLWTLLSLH